MTPDTRTCRSCGVTQPITNFAEANKRRHPGHRRHSCRECVRIYQRSATYTASRVARTYRRYGLDADTYSALLLSQNNTCAICHSSCTIKPRLSIDHDHASGTVRGLLCSECNSALGKFRDSPLLLSRALTYLLAHAPA